MFNRWMGLALFLAACGGSSPMGDGASPLGARNLLGYGIDPLATVTLERPGFGVTSTGTGAFHILWTGAPSDVLEGTLTTDGAFDPSRTTTAGGKELVANTVDRIEFRVNPMATSPGIDLYTTKAPIYLDVLLNSDRAAAGITFKREGKQQLSAYNPVALTTLQGTR